MKLYYAAGTCSLSPHIIALEAGIPITLDRVDIARTPHRTETGADFAAISPGGYVPALVLDDCSVLTEGAAIVQYLADLKPETDLMPAVGTLERVRVQSWLVFIATELHKSFSPWLFHPEVGPTAQDYARAKIVDRTGLLERHLAAAGPYLMGERFGVADAYLFTILGWSRFAKIDLTPFPSVSALLDRVGARPAVHDALAAERQKVAA